VQFTFLGDAASGQRLSDTCRWHEEFLSGILYVFTNPGVFFHYLCLAGEPRVRSRSLMVTLPCGEKMANWLTSKLSPKNLRRTPWTALSVALVW
jgi:hypothetical protein